MSGGLSLFLRANLVDLIIVIIIAVAIYRGFKRGFIKEFLGFAGLLVSLIMAVRYMSDLAAILYGVNLPSQLTTVVAFVIIFVPVMLFFRWLSLKLKVLSKFSFTLGSIDRLAGMGFGLIKGAILVSILAVLISLSGLSIAFNDQISKSQLFKPMKQVLPLAYSFSKVFIVGRYKSFYKEVKESLNVNDKALLDPAAEEFLRDFQKK
ncbi:MAG: CvpA family protein [Calditrichaeota bacterium]|nr:CvpA family protein [Calditrichota bacterium]